jgi:hypothetical protein
MYVCLRTRRFVDTPTRTHADVPIYTRVQGRESLVLWSSQWQAGKLHRGDTYEWGWPLYPMWMDSCCLHVPYVSNASAHVILIVDHAAGWT